jgi:hypothetical protein
MFVFKKMLQSCKHALEAESVRRRDRSCKKEAIANPYLTFF